MNTYVAVSVEELRIAKELIEIAVEPMMMEALPPDFLEDVRRELLRELIWTARGREQIGKVLGSGERPEAGPGPVAPEARCLQRARREGRLVSLHGGLRHAAHPPPQGEFMHWNSRRAELVWAAKRRQPRPYGSA
ncbi:MAG: hypothetical protein JNL21_20260 [Myxococcales bacterium]|nr:hypothetical protein [Myxococcales bacterium]